MKFLCALLLVCAFEAALTQRVVPGPCPAVTPQAGIVNSEFLGRWEGGFRVDFAPTRGTKCNYACYVEKNGVLSVTNHFVTVSTGVASSIASFVGKFDAPGVFTVNINGRDTTFNILALNKDAASIFACNDNNNGTVSQDAFGITRTKPTEETLAFARNGFTAQGISLDGISYNDQEGCPAPVC